MKAALTVLCVGALIGPVLASATPIIYTGGGILNLSGLSVDVTGNPSSGCIHFYPMGGTPNTCGTSSSFGIVSPTDTSAFTAASATIQDVPAADNGSLTSFISTTGPQGTVNFDLLSLISGGTNFCNANTANGALPASCTLPGSPFDFLIASPSDITVEFSTNLCAYTGPSAGVNCSNGTLYTGQFHAGFIGTFVNNGVTEAVSLANLISAEQSSFGITDSVAATLTPSLVPEPGTYLLLGVGLIGLSLFGRRKRA